MQSRSLERGLLVALATVALPYLFFLSSYGLMTNDDGWVLHPVLRMSDGELLYRDVWTFYAPLRHHVLEAIFSITGPSIVAMRFVWAACLLATALVAYRIGRRFAPVGIAFLPALAYLLAPGPWHKAPYGFCTALFFLAGVRFLERPGVRRSLLLGLAVGVTLVTRQDLGLAQLGLAGAATLLPILWPRSLGRETRDFAGAIQGSSVLLLGISAVVLPLVLYYAARGALGDYLYWNFAVAFGQMGAHTPGWIRLLSPESFGTAAEGRGVGLVMLFPLFLYPVVAGLLLRAFRRRAVGPSTLLIAGLLVYGAATLAQVYSPMLLLRVLQSALPAHLLAAFVAATAVRAVSRRAALRALPVLALGLAEGGLVWLAVIGVPTVRPAEEYTGSLRVAKLDRPVTVLGDRLFVSGELAEEIRLIRAFTDERVPPGEPIFAAPNHSSWYLILERSNPTRILGEHFHGDFVMSSDQKRAEMQRLLDSRLRFVVAEVAWLTSPYPPDEMRRTLLEHFAISREYGRFALLERSADERRRLVAVRTRIERGGAAGVDLGTVRAIADAHRGEPYPRRLLAALLVAGDRVDDAVAALEEAAALDPRDPRPLEDAAALLAAKRRRREAAGFLSRAFERAETPHGLAVRERLSPTYRE